jgi:hypothetical protein
MDPQDIEKSMLSGSDNFVVDNNTSEKNIANADTYNQELNAHWKKRLSRDIYVSEAVEIIIDCINLTSKK